MAQPAKKTRKHRKSRTVGSESTRRSESNSTTRSRGGASGDPGVLQQQHEARPTLAESSRNSQLVDLVVEDREAEERERAKGQREFGSVSVGPEHRLFQ